MRTDHVERVVGCWNPWNKTYSKKCTSLYKQNCPSRVGTYLDICPEEVPSMASMGNKITRNHNEDNIRYNLSPLLRIPTLPEPATKKPSLTNSEDQNLTEGLQLNYIIKPGYSDEIISYLVQKLETDKSKSFLGTLPKQFERAKKKETQGIPKLQPPKGTDLERITVKQARLLFLGSKSGISYLQHYMEDGSSNERFTLLRIVGKDLDFFITHKLGHLAFNRLFEIDKAIQLKVYSRIMKSFRKFAVHEFASRILQELVRVNDEFRREILSAFKNDHDLWLKNIASLFLLSTCMDSSTNHEDYNFVKACLLRDRNELFSDGSKMRALVSLIGVCSSSELDDIFDFLYRDRCLGDDFDVKPQTYFILAFIRREYQPILEGLKKVLQGKLTSLVTKPYFKLLMNKILVSGSQKSLKVVNRGLMLVKSSELSQFLLSPRPKSDFYYTVFLIISTQLNLKDVSNTAIFMDFFKILANDNLLFCFDSQLQTLMLNMMQRISSSI